MNSNENEQKDIKFILETQAELNALKEKRQKEVFNAICALIDPVSVDVLNDNLNILDYNSWDNIIDERFLDRLCGYPICKKRISVDFSKKFVVDKHKNLVYETDHELNKFCSTACLILSKKIRSQLHKDPLWITGNREPKIYHIETETDHKKILSNIQVKDTIESIKLSKNLTDVLVRLEELKIAERDDSDSDSDNKSIDNVLDEHDEKAFEIAIKKNKIKF